MQLIMSMLLRQLGGGASQTTQGPFANPFGGTGRQGGDADDVIEVDAQVVDDAKRAASRAWQGSAAPALGGTAPSRAPLVYEVLVALIVLVVLAWPLHLNPLLALEFALIVLCALNDVRMGKVPVPALVVCGVLAVALRVQALLAGGIASLIIVPAVAGLAFAVILGLAVFGLNARYGARRTLMSVDDLGALPVFGVLVGYPFVLDLAVAWLLAFCVGRLTKRRTLPLMPFWATATLIHWFAFGFLGLGR